MDIDINRGDKIRVTRGHRYVEGIVTRASWWNSVWDISYDLTMNTGVAVSGCGRWKQGEDGGTVEVLERAPEVGA